MKKSRRDTPARLAPLDDGRTVELAETFRLMGDASRLKIVLACLNGPLSVSEIAKRVELSASLVSHHLRLLRAARLLRAKRKGKQVFYQAADAHISCVVADMVAHVTEPVRHGERA